MKFGKILCFVTPICAIAATAGQAPAMRGPLKSQKCLWSKVSQQNLCT